VNYEGSNEGVKLKPQFLEYIQAEGLSIPRQVWYIYVLRKLSSLVGKEFRYTTKTDMIRVIIGLRNKTAYETLRKAMYQEILQMATKH
jgi:hypothetical protein